MPTIPTAPAQNPTQPTTGGLSPQMTSAFDQATGWKTPASGAPSQSRSDEILALGKTAQDAQDASANAPKSPIDYIKQYASDVGKDYESAVPDFMAAAGSGKTGSSVANVAEGTLRATSSGIGTVFAPVTEGIKALTDVASDDPNMQKFVQLPAVKGMLDFMNGLGDKFGDWASKNPEAAKNLQSALNVGGAAIGGEAEPALNEGIESIAGGATDAAKAAASVPGKAVDLAGSGMLKAADTIHNTLPDNVKTALENPKMASQNVGILKKYSDAQTTANKVTGSPTPLEIAGKEQVGKALTSLKGKLTDAGQKLGSSLELSGTNTVKGLDDILSDAHDKLQERTGATYEPYVNDAPATSGKTFEESVNQLTKLLEGKGSEPSDKESLFGSAPNRSNTLDTSEQKKVSSMFEGIMSLRDDPTVQKANDFVDRMQGDLYKSKLPGATPINDKVAGLMKEVVGKVNKAAKEAGGNMYSEANSTYSRVRQLHDTLSRAVGSNYSKAGSLMKRVFSPQDGGAKAFIGAVEKETGVPIFHHATLAKFVMDSMDDPRARSLLEKINEGGSAAPTAYADLKKLASYAVKKGMGSPVDQALRVAARNAAKNK